MHIFVLLLKEIIDLFLDFVSLSQDKEYLLKIQQSKQLSRYIEHISFNIEYTISHGKYIFLKTKFFYN